MLQGLFWVTLGTNRTKETQVRFLWAHGRRRGQEVSAALLPFQGQAAVALQTQRWPGGRRAHAWPERKGTFGGPSSKRPAPPTLAAWAAERHVATARAAGPHPQPRAGGFPWGWETTDHTLRSQVTCSVISSVTDVLSCRTWGG